MNVIVRRAVRLRWLGDDPVAGSTPGVHDRGVQDVRAEGGDVENRRVGQRGATLTVARATPWEGPEYRRYLSGLATRIRRQRRVARAPALDVWIEVCGHKRERRVRWPKRYSLCEKVHFLSEVFALYDCWWKPGPLYDQA